MRIEELETAMGEVSLLKLLRSFGGRRLYVPLNMHADHHIACVIGTDAAMALADLVQGEYVDLPTLARFDRMEKRNRIVGLRKKGKSLDLIAWECKCSRRYVMQVCRDSREEIEREIPGPKMRQLELPIFAGAR
jgi:hypothetical protein